MEWPKLAIFHFSARRMFVLYENVLILGVSIEKVYKKWGKMENLRKKQDFFMLKFDTWCKICQNAQGET